MGVGMLWDRGVWEWVHNGIQVFGSEYDLGYRCMGVRMLWDPVVPAHLYTPRLTSVFIFIYKNFTLPGSQSCPYFFIN